MIWIFLSDGTVASATSSTEVSTLATELREA